MVLMGGVRLLRGLTLCRSPFAPSRLAVAGPGDWGGFEVSVSVLTPCSLWGVFLLLVADDIVVVVVVDVVVFVFCGCCCCCCLCVVVVVCPC